MFNLGYVCYSALFIYVSKDMRMRHYFSKPKGIRQQNILGSTTLVNT